MFDPISQTPHCKANLQPSARGRSLDLDSNICVIVPKSATFVEMFGEAVARKPYECLEAIHIGEFVGEVIACFQHSDIKAWIDTRRGFQCCEIQEMEKASLTERESEK